MSLIFSTKAQVKPREEHRDRVRGIQATLSITGAFLGHSCSVTEGGDCSRLEVAVQRPPRQESLWVGFKPQKNTRATASGKASELCRLGHTGFGVHGRILGTEHQISSD